MCPVGEYCDAPGCNAGFCKPIGNIVDGMKNPVCGCDGVSYWNDTVAAQSGMSVKAAGQCSPSKSCGGIANAQCANGQFCNFKVDNAMSCAIADLSGECWGMPKVCPAIVGIGPQTRECNADSCTDECDLIKSGKGWYDDPSCPK